MKAFINNKIHKVQTYLVVKVLDSQFRDLGFKTTGRLKGQLSLSFFGG